ncbi:calcium-binding protein (plasmid) [Octadecabacter sp. SW4]|uniref:beta strand repeat-containing protein n=1 Tax=Octadecabacter sp. SW4 TaxID=2602067 RepID=UPI0011C203FA|nr:calcium-binding protein [Octadecabacter sp. SW4]QEE37552.1 calcium-binding protein [Octadecabacter sp. SW4]
MIIAPPLPDATIPPTIPQISDGFTLTIDVTVPGSTQTDTLDLVIADDPSRMTAEDLVEALNEALRFTAPDTLRELSLGTLTTSAEFGSMTINTDLAEVMILAGNIFEFEVNDLGLVALTTTDALIKSGLPEFGFEVSYTAVAAGLQTGGAAFGNIHATGTPWEATDASKGYSFAIQIGDGDPIDVILEEDFSRVARADLVEALNEVLLETGVDRDLLSDTAVIGTTTTLSQLFRFVANGDDLTLQTTNFAQVNGYDDFAFSVLGNDTSHDITFEVTELEESNIAQALGFASAIELADLLNDPTYNVVEGDITSSALKAKDISHDAPIVFIDTEATQISANLSVGTPDGLNMVLALGPLEVGIEGGSAFIGASGGEGRGYIAGVVEDIDGTDDGRYDFAHLYGIFQSDDPDFLPLFGLDVDFETRIDLPFSGAFGLLNPDDHGFIYESTLLRTTGNPSDPNDNVVSAADLFGTVEDALNALYLDDPFASDTDAARAAAIALLDEHFVGDAQSLALIGFALTQDELDGLSEPIADLAVLGDTRAGDLLPDGTLPFDYYAPSGGAAYGPHYMELNLPGVGLFDCAGILDLLNDPLAIVNGLDMMAGTIQGFIDEFMADLNLPLIGENLAIGAGFFDDLVYDVLDEVRADLETPLAETGALPTTLDLINVLMNRALNLMLDPEDTAADQQYIAAAIYGGAGEPAIYGSMSFNYEVFNADLAVGLALEIPGLNLEAESGSTINLTTTMDIDLGFGLDCDGFFVLNDTDSPEIALIFAATANDFEGGFNVGGVLDIEATATAGAQTSVVSTVGLDLFGQSGIDTGAGLELDRSYGFAETELQGLVATDAGSANQLGPDRFDKTVYLPQIDFGDFATFTFSADVQMHLDLLARFDVGSGAPELTTDFIFVAAIPPNPIGEATSNDIIITELKFDNIALQTGTIAEMVGTVLNPIGDMLAPVTDVFNQLSTVTPLNYALSAISTVFPVINVGNQINSILQSLGPAGDLPTSADGGICIGTYNFLGFKSQVALSDFRASDAIFFPCIGIDYNFGFSSAVSGPGISIDIPLLTDPSNALNMLLGNFDRVSLVEVDFNLLDADINANISAAITGNLGLPSWISGAVRNAFTAEVDIDFSAGMTVGYDLSGIVNFANSYDPERLLDGVFIDAAPGALIDGSIRGNFGLNASIAGASGSIGGDVNLTFTDPNNDGKLRLTELIAQVELLGTLETPSLDEILGVFFTGEVSFSAALSIWGGINFPSPLPDLSFSTTVFNETLFSYTLDPTLVPPEIADMFGSGSNTTAVLNVGARAGNNLSSISQDGDDTIVVNANGFVNYTSNGQVFSTSGGQTIDPTRGLVIAAGEGTNTIDLSALTSGTSASITYTGDGNDTINLAQNGTHVVFAGGGTDTINLVNGSGTYYIFAEDGADTMNLTTAAGGTVYVFGGDDFGMREHFLSTFNANGQSISQFVTPATIAAQFTNANMQLSGVGNSLSTFEDLYTRSTQLTGQGDDEVITIGGSGNANIFTGRGDDLIAVSGAGDANVYTGGGNDQINFTGTGTTQTEAGAGADLVTFTGGANTAYGWGEVSASDEASGALDHLMRADGDDIIIGEAGADSFFGQYGNDILGGGEGNDLLDGGFDDDLMSGGNLEVRTLDSDGVPSATLIDLTDPNAVDNLQSRLQVTTQDLNDGRDSLRGGAGNDILLGGGGNDTLAGGDGADLVVGDYGQINVSTNRVAETFVSTGMESVTAGTDVLDGGAGGDILIAGGAQNVDVTEVIVDLVGDNIVFGDFGLVEGSRILEAVDGYRAIASDTGTRDDITTGAGNDVIIGGERSDTINAGLGGDFVIGDLGDFLPTGGLVNGEDIRDAVIVSTVDPNDGDDQISFGVSGEDDLFDVVVGGGGDDDVTSVNGGLAMIGDYGQIFLSPAGVRALLGLLPLSTTATPEQIEAYNAQIALIERLVKSMETIDADGNVYGDIGAGSLFGDDSITTTEGGNVFAILGGNTMAPDGTMGGDTATLADGLSYLITDDGRLTIEQIAADVPGGSFGAVTGDAFSTQFAGNDTVITGEGRDIILTGDLDDVVSAGDGLNIVMTDNGTLLTSDVLTAAPTTLTSRAGRAMAMTHTQAEQMTIWSCSGWHQ